MADVLNRTTRQFQPSVNTPDFPVADWIINPDMSAVTGFASKYWVITGDVVTLMSAAEQGAVDDQALQTTRDAVADQMDGVEDVLRAFALVVLDEINTLRAQHLMQPRTIAQLKTAIRGKLGS